MSEFRQAQIARQINYKRTQHVHSMSTLLAMFGMAKKNQLIPEHCTEYEFTIVKTSDNDIICLGVEYWPTNKRTDQKKLAGIPRELQPMFNAYARRVIRYT